MSKSIWFQPLSIDDFKDSSVNMDKHLDIEIVEIGDDSVKVDFNHPLAGRNIIFKVDIVEVAPNSVH